MQNVDFLPERIRAQRRRSRRVAKHTYMLTICLAGLTILGFLRNGQIQTVRAEEGQLGAQESDIDLQLARRDSLEREKAELYVIQKIDGQLGSRLSAFMLLSELQGLLPESVVLTQLSVETMDVLVASGGTKANRARGVRTAAARSGGTDATVKRLRLTLTGLATKDVDVANFIGQVSACPLFEDVNMSYSRDVKIEDRTARQFQASCYVVR